MKQIIIALVTTLLVNTTHAQIQKIELQAAGVTCSMCSKAINKSLLTLPYIATVKPLLDKNIFEITLNDSVAFSLDEIKKKVESAGFSVGNLWITVTVNNAAIKNDAHIASGSLNLHFVNVKEQQLNGAVRLKVLDKGFTSNKENKKYALFTKLDCYKTGYMGSCCGKAAADKPVRIFHVTI
jgi:copper chaperone CopZ